MTRLATVVLAVLLLTACSDNKGGGSPGSDVPQVPPAPTGSQQTLFPTPTAS